MSAMTPDDWTYAELMAQAHALIPALAPEWTDHNVSDPGITLVELLAWLTEMAIFQVGQAPGTHTATFLSLLNGPDWTPPDTQRTGPAELTADVRDTVRALRERYRAVTADDYEYLLTSTWPGSKAAAELGAAAALRQVSCVPRRDLTRTDPQARADEAPTHVSVVVLPQPSGPQDTYPVPGPALIKALQDFLDPRRILTTHHHVVGPSYVDAGVSANVALRDDAPPDQSLAAARDALRSACDPISGGPGGTGWRFGEAIRVSQIYAVLEQVPALDWIEDVTLTGPNLIRAVDGTVTGLWLDADELVRISAVDLTGYDTYNRPHPYRWRLA
jgi:hypothetical protein